MNIDRICTNVKMSGAHKKMGLSTLVKEVEGGLDNIKARKTN